VRARLFRVLRSQGGFTLLELVIAMAILGLILAILGSALRISQNTILTGRRSMERTHRARVITEQISQELRSAYRPSQVGTSVEAVAFRGEADRFSFVTTASMRSRGFVQSGLKEVTLSVEEDADTGRRGLVLREDIIPNGELFEEGKGQLIMLDPTVEAIKYRYFGSPPTTGGTPPPPPVGGELEERHSPKGRRISSNFQETGRGQGDGDSAHHLGVADRADHGA